jgi:phage-related protein
VYDAGTAALQVVPSFKGIEAQIKAISKEIGDSIAKAVEGAIPEGLDKGSKRAKPPATKGGALAGGAFGDAMRARIEAAMQALPKVKVDGDTSDTDRKLAQIRTELADLSRQRIGIDVDEQVALAQLDRLQAELDRLGADSPSIRVQVDTAAASAALASIRAEALTPVRVPVEPTGDFARSLQQQVRAAAAALPNIPLTADSTDADRKLAGLRAELTALADQRVGVDIDDQAALAKVTELRAQLVALSAESPSVRVQVDAAAAEAALAAFEAQVTAVDAQDVQVDVETNAAASEGEIRGLVATVITLLPAIVPAAAAASAALAGIGLAAGAGIVGLGVAKLGLSGVSDAVKALTTSQTSGASTAASYAQQQNQAANAADQLWSAERSLTTAQQQATQAQQALTAARQQAAQTLQDLQNQVVDGAIAQERAELAVAQAQQQVVETQQALTAAQAAATQANNQVAAAQQRLNAAQSAGNPAQILAAQQQLAASQQAQAAAQQDVTKAALEARAAQIAQQAAVQSVKEQVLQNQRLAAQERATSAAGVEGSAQVVAAQQRIQQADQQVLAAERALAAAHRAVGAAAVQAGTSGSAATNQLAQAMSNLSPAGQAFALFLASLKPRLDALRATAQAGLLPGVQAGITSLVPSLGQVNLLVGAVAATLGDLARQAGAALAGPWWQQFFALVSAQIVPALRTMGQTLGNVATGSAGLFAQMIPLGVQFGQVLLGASQRFADFGRTAGSNPQLQQFLAYARQSLPVVVTLIGNLAGAGVQLVTALAPVGTTILQGLSGMAATIRNIPVQVLTGVAGAIVAIVAASKGLGVLKAAFAFVVDANPLLLVAGAIAAIVTGAGAASGSLGPLLSTLSTSLAPVIQTLTAALQSGLTAVLPVVVTLLTTLAPIIGQVAGALAGLLVPVFGILVNTLSTLLPVLIPIITLVGGVLVQAITMVTPLLTQLGSLIATALGAVLPIVTPLIGAFSQIVGAVLPLVGLFLRLAGSVLPAILPVITLLAGLLAGLLPPILGLVTSLVSALVPALMQILPPVLSIVPLLIGALMPALQALVPVIVQLVTTVLGALMPVITALMPVITLLAQLLGTVLGTVLSGVLVPLLTKTLVPALQLVATVLSWLISNIVGPLLTMAAGQFLFVIQNIIVPVLKFLVGIFQWIYDVLLGHSIIPDIVNGVTFWFGLMAAGISAVMSGVKLVFSAVWGFIRDWIFRPIMTFVTVDVPAGFRAGIQFVSNAWANLKAIIANPWNWAQANVFTPMRNLLTQTIPGAFKAGVAAIGKAWAEVQNVAKAPIHFVVHTVLQDGLLSAFNWLAGKVGIKTTLSLPKSVLALKSGGLVSGPGGPRDDKVPAMLSNEEYVVNAAAVRSVGVPFLNWVNSLGLKKPGVRQPGDGSQGVAFVPHFADGGLVGLARSFWDTVTDPAGALKKAANGLLDKIPGGGIVRDLASKTAGQLIGGVAAHLGDLMSTGGGGSTGGYHGPITESIRSVWRFIEAQNHKPYIWASAGPTGFDCSGIASAVWNYAHGKSPWNHTFSTSNEAGFFPKAGWGLYTAGWANPGERGGGDVGHTAGNYAGLAFESGGGPGDTHYGSSSTPVTSFAHIGHYDQGGQLPPGLSMVYNGLRQPEAVFTPDQVRQMDTSRGRPVSRTVNVYPQRVDFSLADLWQAEHRQDVLERIGRQE